MSMPSSGVLLLFIYLFVLFVVHCLCFILFVCFVCLFVLFCFVFVLFLFDCHFIHTCLLILLFASSIREEIKEIEDGKYPKDNNVLKNSPHPLQVRLIILDIQDNSTISLAHTHTHTHTHTPHTDGGVCQVGQALLGGEGRVPPAFPARPQDLAWLRPCQ